jgi:hypothetical protein
MLCVAGRERCSVAWCGQVWMLERLAARTDHVSDLALAGRMRGAAPAIMTRPCRWGVG